MHATMNTNSTLKILQIALLAAVLTACASAPEQPGTSAEMQDADLVASNSTSDASVEAVSAEVKAEPIRRYAVDARSHHCLAEALYWEARGEGEDGMLAVSAVVLNRVEDERFPDTVCEVVREGGESRGCQFSWWCDGKSDHPTERELWIEILELSHTYLATRPADPTDGALFYHANYIKRPWRRQQTAQIGKHIFYR